MGSAHLLPARYASTAEEVERLRGEVAAKEGALREAKDAEREFAAELERQEQEFGQERARLQVRGGNVV